jgi:hypothetical protein
VVDVEGDKGLARAAAHGRCDGVVVVSGGNVVEGADAELEELGVEMRFDV